MVGNIKNLYIGWLAIILVCIFYTSKLINKPWTYSICKLSFSLKKDKKISKDTKVINKEIIKLLFKRVIIPTTTENNDSIFQMLSHMEDQTYHFEWF